MESRMEDWVESGLNNRGYVQMRLIGTGGFGTVHLVKNVRTGKLLACKSANTCQTAKMLKNEAGMLKQIRHSLFVSFEEMWEEKQGVLLLMEYVEGQSLGVRLRQGPLSPGQAVWYAMCLAEGLKYLHEMPVPVLYRDLKPENIKVGADGRIKLLDLGCACRLTDIRFSKAGTRGYAPPEQLIQGQPGLYSDVYALGRLLQYMLTGDNPCMIPGDRADVSPRNTYSKTSNPFLEKLIERCTEENYQERIPDMNCVLQNLKRYGKEESFLYEKIVRKI